MSPVTHLPPAAAAALHAAEAPAGSFVTGSTVTLCPKGEYSDDYSLSTSCKTCEDLFSGPGITTAREGATSASNCVQGMSCTCTADVPPIRLMQTKSTVASVVTKGRDPKEMHEHTTGLATGLASLPTGSGVVQAF
jgi:hypothetical protein